MPLVLSVLHSLLLLFPGALNIVLKRMIVIAFVLNVIVVSIQLIVLLIALQTCFLIVHIRLLMVQAQLARSANWAICGVHLLVQPAQRLRHAPQLLMVAVA